MNMSTVIMAMEKAAAAMERMVTIMAITMSMEKAAAVMRSMVIIMAMGKAAAVMRSLVTMTIIMRTRVSQAGAGKQRINIRTRSLISC